jgi:hypothetical protein
MLSLDSEESHGNVQSQVFVLLLLLPIIITSIRPSLAWMYAFTERIPRLGKLN